VALGLAPILALFMVAAAAGTLIQTGLLFSTDRIKPKLEHISPLSGFKRIFGMRGALEFGKNVLKLSVVACVVAWVAMPELDRMKLMPSFEPAQLASETWAVTLRMVVAAIAILTLVAIGDYVHQKFAFLRSMRMSKHEVKEEYKQQEGDPHIKGKLKQIRAEKARRRMIAAVPDASVVITNPTHFAVALQYDLEKSAAPRLVAKGVDRVALRIREVAGENEVPIVENPPLARAIYRQVEVGEFIPGDLFEAVAEVLAYLIRLKQLVL
jgi:flagellar biosynthesis protein FlhB